MSLAFELQFFAHCASAFLKKVVFAFVLPSEFPRGSDLFIRFVVEEGGCRSEGRLRNCNMRQICSIQRKRLASHSPSDRVPDPWLIAGCKCFENGYEVVVQYVVHPNPTPLYCESKQNFEKASGATS